MAFPHMSAFFVQQDSIDRLGGAPDDRTAVRHTFPYDRALPAHVDIRYHHAGELTWNAPGSVDMQVLILISRVPKKSRVTDYYQLWAFEKDHIAGLISEAGKITSGTIKKALDIGKESTVRLDSKQIETAGVAFFEGEYAAVCDWIDQIGKKGLHHG